MLGFFLTQVAIGKLPGTASLYNDQGLLPPARLTLFHTWIINYMPGEIGVEIIYPFPKFDGSRLKFALR